MVITNRRGDATKEQPKARINVCGDFGSFVDVRGSELQQRPCTPLVQTQIKIIESAHCLASYWFALVV